MFCLASLRNWQHPLGDSSGPEKPVLKANSHRRWQLPQRNTLLSNENPICTTDLVQTPRNNRGPAKSPLPAWSYVVLSKVSPNLGPHDRILRIATRKSPLALWQAEHVAQLLAANSVKTRLVPLASIGDIDMRPIDGTRQVGVFTKRIQQALTDDEADIAVHSLKDLPTQPDPRYALVAIPERETVYDSLVSPSGMALTELPPQARVGTGSRRRAAQLLWQRDDLRIEPIRGNVQTRLAKLKSEPFDAIILAEAGLLRLQMHDLPRVQISLDEMLPAPGQGALGIETRSDDVQARDSLAAVDHPATRAAVTAERTVLAKLHGGCLAPIAAYATVADQRLSLQSVVLSADGKERLIESESCELPKASNQWESIASDLATTVAGRLIDAGASELIAQVR